MTRRTGLRAGPPSSDAVVTVDPATGDEIARYSAFDDAEIEAVLAAGHDAATQWAATPLAQRLPLLAALADALRAGRHEFAKKAVLELGGSDPFVVLDDADLDAASTAAVRSRFLNSGQSCVCAKRILVAEPVAEQFTRMPVEKTEALVVGDPADPATRIGPLARPDLRDNLHAQVLRTIEQGGRLLTGGRLLDGPGNYYAPTLLGGVRPGMTAFDEETFGPVAALAVGAYDDRLVELANASRYGLGLSVWSADTDRALRVARRITSGAAFVNAIVASDPRVPFGGAKQSGHGRELAAAGLREFCLVRTYWVADPPAEVTAVAVCAEPT